MQSAVPVFRIRDIVISEKFYCDALGFTVDWRWRQTEGAPVFLQLSREDIKLYLTENTDSAFGAMAYLYVEDVNRWYNEILKYGAGVDALPQDKPWGNREMQISDPDGNKLRICTAL